jgi:hypothetical protein
MRRLFLFMILAGLPIVAAAAAPIVPSAIVANPSAYDGHTVTVAGSVTHFRTRDTAIGNFTMFNLCDSQCIVVVDKTSQPHTDNSAVTVTGLFHASFQGPKKMWSNVLTIGF